MDHFSCFDSRRIIEPCHFKTPRVHFFRKLVFFYILFFLWTRLTFSKKTLFSIFSKHVAAKLNKSKKMAQNRTNSKYVGSKLTKTTGENYNNYINNLRLSKINLKFFLWKCSTSINANYDDMLVIHLLCLYFSKKLIFSSFVLFIDKTIIITKYCGKDNFSQVLFWSKGLVLQQN